MQQILSQFPVSTFALTTDGQIEGPGLEPAASGSGLEVKHTRFVSSPRGHLTTWYNVARHLQRGEVKIKEIPALGVKESVRRLESNGTSLEIFGDNPRDSAEVTYAGEDGLSVRFNYALGGSTYSETVGYESGGLGISAKHMQNYHPSRSGAAGPFAPVKGPIPVATLSTEFVMPLEIARIFLDSPHLSATSSAVEILLAFSARLLTDPTVDHGQALKVRDTLGNWHDLQGKEIPAGIDIKPENIVVGTGIVIDEWRSPVKGPVRISTADLSLEPGKDGATAIRVKFNYNKPVGPLTRPATPPLPATAWDLWNYLKQLVTTTP